MPIQSSKAPPSDGGVNEIPKKARSRCPNIKDGLHSYASCFYQNDYANMIFFKKYKYTVELLTIIIKKLKTAVQCQSRIHTCQLSNASSSPIHFSFYVPPNPTPSLSLLLSIPFSFYFPLGDGVTGFYPSAPFPSPPLPLPPAPADTSE